MAPRDRCLLEVDCFAYSVTIAIVAATAITAAVTIAGDIAAGFIATAIEIVAKSFNFIVHITITSSTIHIATAIIASTTESTALIAIIRVSFFATLAISKEVIAVVVEPVDDRLATIFIDSVVEAMN